MSRTSKRKDEIAARIQLPLTRAELEAIEDVRFSQRFHARTDCIRTLIEKGIAALEREQASTGAAA
ncbi:hypothetical protein V5F31_06010 [Xanthobacter sp. V7C-4]|uniref:hypothetical protein n=1 Tax=Xanthobacter autotrophicus (strain ATCC BAA-1158 / Py2) TaxID=78245 RepID=UPI00372C0E35